METASPRKKLKTPNKEGSSNNTNVVTCTNVPESLFDAAVAKKHFSKFGKVHRITLFPKRHTCMVEYDQLASVQRAVLNAGAFDGFQFDVTRTKPRVRRQSKKDDDPDWLPDADVEKELSAMSEVPTYRSLRQKSMDFALPKEVAVTKGIKPFPLKKKAPIRELPPVLTQVSNNIEAPVTMSQTSLSTAEAAIELCQLCLRISLTPDEQWRTLDARDRILRQWGGSGARVKVGGATIGTCPDMCPEKERLHRQAEHQVMTLESMIESDSTLEEWRAVKQYSRSSADQEMPMCYELRPASVLTMTCSYLLHEVADSNRQISLADWFHFLWDRFRGIRKDITQQALCCAESICLVEMCARFHAHCAARLADLEHTQFDQKLNTDNLTKCLQTLKHMYADVDSSQKPREAEFRGYIALLNLGDSNFWWEIKQLPDEIQKSEPITFAIKIFNALDNNNYVRFFRLVREQASYLQACILLRYFNDVRARALARIVKAFAPRGGSRYPAEELINSLAFESSKCMMAFINHYGLRCSKIDDTELAVILDRNNFIEDSDPYQIAREIQLIETKRRCTVGEVIAGGQLPSPEYKNHILISSFTKDGILKEGFLTGEELGYSTNNDTNADIRALKVEVQRISHGDKKYHVDKAMETKPSVFVKPESKILTSAQNSKTKFSFQAAIPVAPTEIIKKSPEKIFEVNNKNIFSFSKPAETTPSNLWSVKDSSNLFKSPLVKFDEKTPVNTNVFGKANIENKDPVRNTQSLNEDLVHSRDSNMFKKSDCGNSTFGLISEEAKAGFGMPQKSVSGDVNIFKKPLVGMSVFGQIKSDKDSTQIFGAPRKTNEDAPSSQPVKNVFYSSNPSGSVKSNNTIQQRGNIFAKNVEPKYDISNDPKSIFGSVKPIISGKPNIFSTSKDEESNNAKSPFAINGDPTNNNVSPGSLFKSVMKTQNEASSEYSVFQKKKPMEPTTVAANIFNSVNPLNKGKVYDFDHQNELLQSKIKEEKNTLEEARKEQENIEELKRQQQQMEHARELQKEMKERELKKIEEIKRLQEVKRQAEQQRREEENRQEELRKQEQLRKKLEEEKRLAEIKRKTEEENKFKQRVDIESSELIDELFKEVNAETVVHHLKEEIKLFNDLMSYANVVSNEIISELCSEICEAEAKAEKLWAEKLMKKWFNVWRCNLLRNLRRRKLLVDTPVWISERSPKEISHLLKRFVEDSALKNMNAIHRGYRFRGELKLQPTPQPYNLMDIIKSPLLKRMKQINYPYNKCFFWKLTLVSPGSSKWLSRKIEIQSWLLDAFSDKIIHETSDSLINVGKQSWNNLMDFAISVSVANTQNSKSYSEAFDGSNALLYYTTEDDNDLIVTIEATLKHKYQYQVIPVAIIIPQSKEATLNDKLQKYLTYLMNIKSILCFRVFTVDSKSIWESLNNSTKSALKWLAKKYPQVPPIEIDKLKSVCQRYLGNEVWCRLKVERDTQLRYILKDLVKLVKIYNIAVDKLTQVITNEELFNYPSFPLEFKQYLNDSSPYPKPNEFIPSNVKTSENVSAIKDLMRQLRLPDPQMQFDPMSVVTMQDNIRTYCNQIGWFQNPEEVVCKVVAILPTEFSNENLTCDQFVKIFEELDFLDILNIIVYEKINHLRNFDNRYAIYEKTALEEYRSCHWWFDTAVTSKGDQKALTYVDDVDYVIEAKRRKISQSCFDLTLEENDYTMVEENIKANDENMSKYFTHYEETVEQLEKKVEEEHLRSLEFENLLRSALSNI